MLIVQPPTIVEDRIGIGKGPAVITQCDRADKQSPEIAAGQQTPRVSK